MVSSKSVLIFLITVLLLHFAATFNYWYWTYLWLDIPMHFLGGFWTAMAFIYLISNYQFPISGEFLKRNLLSYFVIILSFVALIGIFQEFYEFLNDILFSSKGYSQIFQQGAADTMGDLFFDLLGGTFFAVIFKLFFRKI